MTTRSYHRKSRGGCNSCKARRIKCDENGPPCYGCVTRRLTCEYSNRARLVQQPKAPSNIIVSDAPRPRPYSPSAGALSQVTGPGSIDNLAGQALSDHRKTELALMNHWTASTHLTFCHQTLQRSQAEEGKFWQQEMPKQALEYPYLLYAMFSVTNLHLASQSGNLSLKDKHITAGIEYHSLSLRLFMQAVSNATRDNCQAIYICSLAFFVLGIALPQMVPIQREDQASVRDSIFECLELFKGPRRILGMFEQELRNQPSATVLAPKDMSVYPLEDEEFAQAVARLRQCHGVSPPTPQDIGATSRFKSITAAINELDSCSKRLVNGVHAALVGWLIGLDDEFLRALREYNVLATITVMHWAVLLDKPNRLWWSFRSGQSLVRELSSEITVLDALELEPYRWCCTQVGISSCK